MSEKHLRWVCLAGIRNSLARVEVDFLTKKLDQLNEGPARLAVAYNQIIEKSASFVQLLESLFWGS